MPKPNQPPPVLMTATELAEGLCISQQKLTALAAQGRIPKAGPNCYDALKAVPAFLQWSENGENSPAREKVRAESEIHRRDLLKAQADMMGRKCDLLDAQFIPRAEVEAALAPIFKQWEADSQELLIDGLPKNARNFTAREWKQWMMDAVDEIITRARYGKGPNAPGSKA